MSYPSHKKLHINNIERIGNPISFLHNTAIPKSVMYLSTFTLYSVRKDSNVFEQTSKYTLINLAKLD